MKGTPEYARDGRSPNRSPRHHRDRFARRASGMTWKAISIAEGGTGSLGQQSSVREMVHRDGPWLESLLAQRKAARRRLRRWVEHGGFCVVCGAPMIGRKSNCSNGCYEIATHLRFLTSPSLWAAHRRIIRERDGYGPEPEYLTPRTKFRWLVSGSHVHSLATRALRADWPIVLAFPQQIREQLEAEAA